MKNVKGQITIYFALMLLFVMTCLAFVINVGLFVKAKINLQNAVDAAAFSGASVQARGLSSIAYLNWEMRNTYKEWMFKYYVLGTMALSKTQPPSVQRTGTVDFRPKPGFVNENATSGRKGDFFNIPTVCINPATAESDICEIYFVPGIPRFTPLGLTGIDESIAEFTNIVSQEKAKSCIQRGKINFLTALNWAFGISQMSATPTIFAEAPRIAWNRPGAWTEALELAMRIRNLEKWMNVRPQKRVCMQGEGCTPVTSLYQQGPIPTYERTVKAFWSGFRNLENNSGDLKKSFMLTELSPKAIPVSESTLNGLLIPSGGATKYYLDLFLSTLNLVTFYSQFTAQSSSFGQGESSVAAEAACAAIKIGIPIPSYPFGYTKNPNVATYYAVKGEAKYIGMFNPFATDTGIPMTAYAAAKPFGGRLGPQLFLINKESPTAILPRVMPPRSYPYISGLSGAISGGTAQGVESFMSYPVPSVLNTSFWVTTAGMPFGGVPGQTPSFGIPNLLYGLYDLSSQGGSASGSIQIITQNLNFSPGATIEKAGLYHPQQYLAFHQNITLTGNQIVGPAAINLALDKVRKPTLYEGMNYMIPSFPESPSTGPSTPAQATRPISDNQFAYFLIAPLWSENAGVDDTAWTYYQGNTVTSYVNQFIKSASLSINTYVEELRKLAEAIRYDSSKLHTELGANVKNYLEAADNLHNVKNMCASTAGQYLHFFVPPECPGTPLLENAVTTLWQQKLQKNPQFSTYYAGRLWRYTPTNPPETSITLPSPNAQLMMTYQPGELSGAESLGMMPHPFLGDDQSFITNTDRNYYSTKFIPVASLLLGGYDNVASLIGGNVMTPYSEREANLPGDLGNVLFSNPLDGPEVSDISSKAAKFPVRQ